MFFPVRKRILQNLWYLYIAEESSNIKEQNWHKNIIAETQKKIYSSLSQSILLSHVLNVAQKFNNWIKECLLAVETDF